MTSGEEIIDTILRAMEENAVRLRFTVRYPSLYHVYLHPDDYEDLHGVLGVVEGEARMALDEVLSRRNTDGPFDRMSVLALGRTIGRRRSHEPAGGSWTIRFASDPDGVIERGQVAVDCDMTLPAGPGEATGSRTVRLSLVREGNRTVRSERAEREGPDVSAEVLATLGYADEAGRHEYSMRKPHIVVGRGGPGVWTDVRIEGPREVSREHLRIRFDPSARRFLLKDLSLNGTTVDGARVPSSAIIVSGEVQGDRNVEVPLPAERIRIGLADAVFIEFSATA